MPETYVMDNEDDCKTAMNILTHIDKKVRWVGKSGRVHKSDGIELITPKEAK